MRQHGPAKGCTASLTAVPEGQFRRKGIIQWVIACKHFADPMFSFHVGYFVPTERSTPGNCEGGLIIGRDKAAPSAHRQGRKLNTRNCCTFFEGTSQARITSSEMA
jgi:hypothetical protein